MRSIEGIRYHIIMDSAEIKPSLEGGDKPPDKTDSEVDTT